MTYVRPHVRKDGTYVKGHTRQKRPRARPDDEVQVWDDIKAAATDVLHRHRATITHHHAVGRDHRPAYDLQHPEPFALALRAAKNSLDPHHIPNPGLLLD